MSDPIDGNFDVEYLRSILRYDPETGLWVWRVKKSQRATVGSIAGYTEPNGMRRTIRIDNHTYLASVLAWLYMTGEWPKITVDHEDRNSLNDKWGNLRLATQLQQTMNRSLRSDSTSGIHGVRQRGTKFGARIKARGNQIWLGTFDTEEEAIAARKEAEAKYFGEFAPKPKQYAGKNLFEE